MSLGILTLLSAHSHGINRLSFKKVAFLWFLSPRIPWQYVQMRKQHWEHQIICEGATVYLTNKHHSTIQRYSTKLITGEAHVFDLYLRMWMLSLFCLPVSWELDESGPFK